MPNRVIKDSIKRSSEIDSLTWFQEVCFYRLMVTADDYGYYYANPVILKSDLFPLKEDVTKASIAEALKRMEEANLIELFENDGKQYLHIKTWDKHQRIRNKTSHFPSIDGSPLTRDSNPRSIDSNPLSNDSESQSNDSESPQTAADCGNPRLESKNPRILESKKKNTARTRVIHPLPFASDSELMAQQQEENEILTAMEEAGIPNTVWNRNRITDLRAQFDKDKIIHALAEAARCNKLSLGYVEGVLNGNGKKPVDDDDGLEKYEGWA